MTRSIVLAGIGGQGTVLASRLIANVALSRGVPVRTAETIGMAQRGGTVFTHVRYGECETDVPASSLVPKNSAALIIAFEPGEAQRALPLLATNGAIVVARKAVRPVTATLAGIPYDGSDQLAYLRKQVDTVIDVDGDAVCQALGNPRVLNVALLGAAAATGMLGMTVEELGQAVERVVKPAFVEVNRQALAEGERIALAQRRAFTENVTLGFTTAVDEDAAVNAIVSDVPDHDARRWQTSE